MVMEEARSLGDLMGRFKVEKKAGGVNSPFNDVVSQVVEKYSDQIDARTKKPWTFGRWCGYLRNIPEYEILRMMKDAGNNPRLFNWHVKEYKKEHK